MSTTFPNIRNIRQPQATYNARTGDLWLTSSAMEGTGVRVEWLHQIRFGENERTTGLVLTYDDMPELLAPITIDENGKFTIHEITVKEE